MAAIILDKDLLTAKNTRYIFIEIILYFSHENRKIIILFNYEVDEDLISQRFAKENDLEITSVERMRIIVDGHYIIIYKFYNRPQHHTDQRILDRKTIRPSCA